MFYFYLFLAFISLLISSQCVASCPVGIENFIAHYQQERHGLPVKLEKPIVSKSPPPESMSVGRTNALHQAIQGKITQNIIKILQHKKCPHINSRDEAGKFPRSLQARTQHAQNHCSHLCRFISGQILYGKTFILSYP